MAYTKTTWKTGDIINADGMNNIETGIEEAHTQLDNKQPAGNYALKSELPTKTSQLTNDSGFLTQHQDLSPYAKTSQIPTKTSQLTNDSGFLTTIPSEYITETELAAKKYLTAVPSEYITETELSAKKYLTSIPSEYVTETELTAKGYASQTEVTNLSKEIDDQQTQIDNIVDDVIEYRGEVENLPNNNTLINKVVEKVPFVKTAETPKFVTSLEEMTDSSKLYVLNGFIYQYGEKTETVVTPGETITVPAKAIIYKDYRYSHSGGAFKEQSGTASIIIPLPKGGVTSATIELVNTSRSMSYTGIYAGTTSTAFPTDGAIASDVWNSTKTIATLTPTTYNLSGAKFLILFISYTNATALASVNVKLNGVALNPVLGTPAEAKQESTTTTEGKTETITTKGFVSTGCAFAPADYESRIITLEALIGTVNEDTALHNSVGKTFPPLQKPASTDYDGYDINLNDMLSDDIYEYIDEVVSNKDNVTKEILGKDESEVYDIVRYTFAKREYLAWQKVNYPKMYAWKNGSTVIYSRSVSPRIGDTMYTTKYIGTAYNTVTAVNATNRSRTVNGLAFVRYESGDIKPTVIYTDIDDERNSNTSITKDGATYNRYPLGDLGANKNKLTPIFIYANEHGDMASTTVEHHETKMCALVVSRFLKDLASGKQANNPFFKYIRDNCMLIVIPVVNPFGFNIRTTGGSGINTDNGYMNVNRCNINRNYDTPGWDYMHTNDVVNDNWYGHYAGSQNETQYVMNTMVESGAVVALSLHGHQGASNLGAVQGQDPDGTYFNENGLSNISKFLNNNYGYSLVDYDVYVGKTHTEIGANNMPDTTCKSPSYITQCGAYGGIVEFSAFDPSSSERVLKFNSKVIENAYAQMINLVALWLSDYLKNK